MENPPLRLCVLVNAGGGSVLGRDLEPELREAFESHGLEADIRLLPGDALEAAARQALERTGPGRHYDAVVAGGGDGTIGLMAGVMAGSGRAFGVLPLGTLNHFAKDLGLPQDIPGAVGVIAARQLRTVDVAEVNGRVFVNNSSIGLYASMVADRDRQRRRAGWGKWPAMSLAFCRVVLRYPLRRVQVVAEGENGRWVRRYRTPLLFIGNNAYEVSLPRPGTRAVLDDGKLSMFIVRNRRPWGLLKVAAHAMLGQLRHERDFESHIVTAVEIRSRSAWMRVSVDGEVVPMRPPLRYAIRPGALRVFAPLRERVGEEAGAS
ncbi:diacylglycerol kinase family lipid kinase [Pseudoroseomonas wenyumeiae]|uniref:Diacylglycerol kinase family lipid kinase n=1 Tax=Teichococcus wenyumeiae TaxID=2478470 RepID=A0A3A9JF13_9PROT|nr:diacylglycerol kinase family protein [Pseudoroseomonas wenyumeiae]RKK02104.1 diacylglycerol kinase family lipid kinase [Pseudoroseomonas wenyumeiae]RMI26525.1 diacylglycerol kinase family lipid kinase [Pseudoroseomonas wenyumeiae]